MAESSDEGELCPVCAEEMTADDMRFLPCPCGFQVRAPARYARPS